MKWTKTPRDIWSWHEWFALWPVTVDSKLGRKVWLEKVERRIFEIGSCYDTDAEYREITTETESEGTK